MRRGEGGRERRGGERGGCSHVPGVHGCSGERGDERGAGSDGKARLLWVGAERCRWAARCLDTDRSQLRLAAEVCLRPECIEYALREGTFRAALGAKDVPVRRKIDPVRVCKSWAVSRQIKQPEVQQEPPPGLPRTIAGGFRGCLAAAPAIYKN